MDFGAAYSQKCHVISVWSVCIADSVKVCVCVVYIISIRCVRAETHSFVWVQHPYRLVSWIPFHVERLSEFKWIPLLIFYFKNLLNLNSVNCSSVSSRLLFIICLNFYSELFKYLYITKPVLVDYSYRLLVCRLLFRLPVLLYNGLWYLLTLIKLQLCSLKVHLR